MLRVLNYLDFTCSNPKKKDNVGTKFMNEQFQFLTETVMKILSDETDFTVIGVLGFQSVGKSTILNAVSKSLSDSRRNPFKVPSEETCFHQTNGIDITVSQDRIILLDLQPMLSGSVLAKMIKQEPQMIAHCHSYEHMVHLSSLELGVWLMSICNLVVVVEDNIENYALWKYLRTIERLKWMIPDVSEISTVPTVSLVNQIKLMHTERSLAAEGTDKDSEAIKKHGKKKRRQKKSGEADQEEKYIFRPEDEFLSSFLFVFNKVEQFDFSISTINQYRSFLNAMFDGTRFKEESQETILPLQIESNEEDSVNFFMIPTAEKASPIVSYQEQVQNVSQRILQMRKNQFKKVITQKEWLRNSVKLWDIIKQSPLIAQFNETLKMTTYASQKTR